MSKGTEGSKLKKEMGIAIKALKDSKTTLFLCRTIAEKKEWFKNKFKLIAMEEAAGEVYKTKCGLKIRFTNTQIIIYDRTGRRHESKRLESFDFNMAARAVRLLRLV